MERVLVEEGIRISIPVRAKLEYLSLFSGKQIKIVNSDRVVLPEQILIVVNPYLRMENCIADGRVCFFEANKFSMPHLNEQCVNKVISLYKKNAHLIKKKTRISERAAFRKALALKLQHAVEYKIKDIRESMGFKQTELRLCQENIISASKALEKMKKMLEQTKAIKKTIGKDGERVKRVIEEMMALKKNNTFKKITFKLNEIVAETPVVYCQHADKTYMLGRYEIHVSLDSNEVKIYNLTRKADGFHHPHVNQSGIPCLGTLSV